MTAIIDKIKKLMALADKNSGATEAEMETALAMAQALMMKHAIDEDAIADKPAPGVIEKKLDGEFRPWMSALAMAAGALNMTKTLESKWSGRNRTSFYFVGRPEGIEASELLFQQLIKEVNRLFKLNMGVKLGLSMDDRRVYRENFKFGCAVRIYNRVQRMLEELRNDNLKAIEKTGSTALVVSSTMDQRLGEINDWVAVKYPKIKKGKESRKKNNLGYGSGWKAGEEAKIREELSK